MTIVAVFFTPCPRLKASLCVARRWSMRRYLYPVSRCIFLLRPHSARRASPFREHTTHAMDSGKDRVSCALTSRSEHWYIAMRARSQQRAQQCAGTTRGT